MIRKKAQGLPINVIIIAAIALVILIIVFVMVSKKIGVFSRGLEGEEKFVVSCLCKAPGTNRACGSSAPAGYETPPESLDECGSWIDCTANCYKKA